jgi:FdhD protein
LHLATNHSQNIIVPDCHLKPPHRKQPLSTKLSISPTEITRLEHGNARSTNDFVAVEEPLEIRLTGANLEPNTDKNIAITMRTPGNDVELAMGFLFTEGIISSAQDIISTQESPDQSIITIHLHDSVVVELDSMERHFYTTSSCGVCGKASIDAVQIKCKIALPQTQWKVETSVLFRLPDALRNAQASFEHTGGIHGCALFHRNGDIIATAEDIGRHNALDKLIGGWLHINVKSNHKISALDQTSDQTSRSELTNKEASQTITFTPLTDQILLLSGRISFELVQKSAMAGIRMIAAVGAPSSLAIDLADELGITLVGFLRGERCNIYTHGQRVALTTKT